MVRGHPRKALWAGRFAAHNWKTTLLVIQTSRRVSKLGPHASRAAHDRRVRREAKRAAADASNAVRRAQAIGVARALDDKRFAKNVRSAGTHAGKATHRAIHPPSEHRLRNGAMAILGASIAAGGALYGWNRKTHDAAATSQQVDQSSAPGEQAVS
jgi:hypothetical protein